MKPAIRAVPYSEVVPGSPPWSEGNSRCTDNEDLLKMIIENQKLSLAQALTLRKLMEEGEEISASYGHPSLTDGVRVVVREEVVRPIGARDLGFLLELGFAYELLTVCGPIISAYELRKYELRK